MPAIRGGATHAASGRPQPPAHFLYPDRVDRDLGSGLPPSRDEGASRSDDAWTAVDDVVRAARSTDDLAIGVLAAVAAVPGVRRVGLGLCEGGGRRLRFVSSDQVAHLAWCDIDAYDDVPLTAVVRSGRPILAELDALESRFPGVVARQREEGTLALAAIPLPGVDDTATIGGLVLFYDQAQAFPDSQQERLLATGRRVAEGVRRLRARDRHDAASAEQRSAEQRSAEQRSAEEEATGRRARVLLDGDPRSAGTARRFLRDQLSRWGVDEQTSQDAELCLSELVTNVVIHAHSTADLSVVLDRDVLTVQVKDLGGPFSGPSPEPALTPEEHLEVFGRGLMLVAAIADRWGSERDAVGTTAWFAHDLVPAASDAVT